MSNWLEKKVKELCVIGRGRVINQNEINSNLGIYPVFSSQTANHGEMGKIETYDFDGEYVTWTTDGANAGTVFYRSGKFNCTNVCGTLKEKEDDSLDLKFFSYLLSTKAKNHVSYLGNPKLMNGIMAEIILKLPELKPEQTRIAKILSTTDEAIVNTQALIAKYQRIKTGLMQDLLTKGIDENGNIRSKETHKFVVKNGIEVPEEWGVQSLSDLFIVKSGATPLREKYEQYFYQGENYWVKTLDLNDGYINNTEESITQKAVKECNCKIRPINTILIAMYGGWNQIGRTGILKTAASTNQAISALINPKKEIDFEYVLYSLQYFKHKWKVFASSTRKDPNITKEDVEKFIIALPQKLDEQNLITKKIKQITNLIDVQYIELGKLNSLKTGLMQDLLSGKVRIKI